MIETRRLRVEGRVQGVGYRHWMTRQAHRLGVIGWVRNRADGSVEALAIGPSDRLDALVAACRQGPPHAVVTGVTEVPAIPEPGLSGFEQRPTV